MSNSFLGDRSLSRSTVYGAKVLRELLSPQFTYHKMPYKSNPEDIMIPSMLARKCVQENAIERKPRALLYVDLARPLTIFCLEDNMSLAIHS